MVSAAGLGLKYMFQTQALATLDQDPPVQNTWYTCLDTTEDVRLIQVQTRQTNDEAVAKTIQIRITIDGNTITSNAESQNNNTIYWWILDSYDTFRITDITSARSIATNYTTMRGQSVKVECRTTAAPGTNQTLDCRVWYETLEVT